MTTLALVFQLVLLLSVATDEVCPISRRSSQKLSSIPYGVGPTMTDPQRLGWVRNFYAAWDHSTRIDQGHEVIDLGVIRHALGCDKTDLATIDDPEAYTRIPTDADWELLVEAYVYGTTHDDGSTHPKGGRHQRGPTVTNYRPEAFSVPIEIRAIPHIGRGVFATEAIPKGTLVVKPTNAMEFSSKEAVRDYLAYLVYHRSEVLCDQFLWLYAVQKSRDDPEDFVVCLDADASSLINSGDLDLDDDDGVWYEDDGLEDVVFDDPESGLQFATEDGEEILYVDVQVFPELRDLLDDDGYANDEGVATLPDDQPLPAAIRRALEGTTADVWMVDSARKGLTTERKRDGTINLGQYQEVTADRRFYGCQEPPVYALWDIAPGDELLMSYGDFSEPDGFAMLGLEHAHGYTEGEDDDSEDEDDNEEDRDSNHNEAEDRGEEEETFLGDGSLDRGSRTFVQADRSANNPSPRTRSEHYSSVVSMLLEDAEE